VFIWNKNRFSFVMKQYLPLSNGFEFVQG
jgi:hypothetical protein